jgi:hypothetical protein
MLAEGTRRFDLYDFFSVLLPGGGLIVGLVPFLPRDAKIFSIGAVAAGVVLGFVFGRGLHALGLLLERPPNAEGSLFAVRGYGIVSNGVSTSHRDLFIEELRGPDEVSPGLVDEFYARVLDAFPDIGLQQQRSELDENDDPELETLYTLVRSQIHMDSRGRSRTFQAVLDFQRTMMVTSLLLFAVYMTYAIMLWTEATSPVAYEAYISYVGPTGWLVALGAVVLLLSAHTTFERIRSNYRRYFIQYLMADFIALYEAADEDIQRPAS